MKVSNGRTIRRLGWRSMKAARTRNLIAIAAILLVLVLSGRKGEAIIHA